MNVFLIRHGETDDNRAAITTGQRDIPLNAAGIIQSMLLATRLKTISCDLVLSSNLSRCLQTTAAVMQYHSCECKALPDLREKSFGVFEGQPYTVYRQALRRSADPERIFTPLGGES